MELYLEKYNNSKKNNNLYIIYKMANKTDNNIMINFEENKDNLNQLGEIIDSKKIIKNKFTKIFQKKNSVIAIILLLLCIYVVLTILIYFLYNYYNRESNFNDNIGLNKKYAKIDPKNKKYTYIPIVGTDDIHGNFFPKINNVKIDSNTFFTYKTGGLAYVSRLINILREEFGSNKVLYFDGGDYFQGGIDSVLFDGEIILDYFNSIGLNGSTIGNHEIDYSRKWIESKIERSKHKTLINNIMDNANGKKAGALGNNHETSHIYDIKLENGDIIKIGVIGITYNMKNDKKIPNTLGNRNSWDNISFFSYIEGLEEESNILRKKGAIAIIAITHFGIVCNQTEAMKLDMYNKYYNQSKCDREDEDSALYKLLDVLNPGIIDAIIAGDTHMETHHWEKDIPIISTLTHGRYINILYLPFKKIGDNKYILVNDEIKIEGPVPACEKIFENYKNCELISSNEIFEAGNLIDYYWHGKKVIEDPIVKPIYDKYFEKYKEYAEEIIVTFEGFDKIKVDGSGDCILCNTYLDAITDISKADFSIINKGLFPESLSPGVLTRVDFYNQMPYLEKICTVDITGEELKLLIGTSQTVGKIFYPSSKLKQSFKIDKNGNKTLINLEIYIDGKPTKIEDNKIYKMASSKYILSENSGDDFAKGVSYDIIHSKYLENKIKCSNLTLDIEIADYFRGKGTINLSNKVDPDNQRIVKYFENK